MDNWGEGMKTEAAVEWMAAALFAVKYSNHDYKLPKFEELPERLKTEWRYLAGDYLDALIPLMEPANA